jgi:hypothetical protein
MADFFRKHIYKILIISLVFNISGVIYFARKIYLTRFYGADSFLTSNEYASILHYDSIPAKADIDKTIILNTLADRYGYISYLEIGQGKAENNFNHIKCRIRLGVDPDPSCNAAFCLTSDDFFNQNKASFDLIFVDGLHHNEQVYRDIINSLSFLNNNGTIVVHDCNPRNEDMQVVPQNQPFWTGDVWKAWLRLRSERDDLEMFVVENSGGCGIIRAGRQSVITIPDTLTYQFLAENRKSVLNLQSVNYFLGRMKVGK